MSGYEDPGHELAHVKLPPHSIEAEQSVLGGLILHNGVWEEVGDLLEAEDFYRKDHRLIFSAMAKLIESDRPADALTVADQLTKEGSLDDAGGQAYLARLAHDTPSTVNVRAWADLVREASVLRRLIGVSRQIADSSFEPEGRDVSAVLEEAECSILEIGESNLRRGKGFQAVRSLLSGTIDRIQDLFESDGDVTGVSTGFTKLDEMTAGLQPGELVIIAGRPSMGKTSLAMNIAEHAAIKNRLPTAIFSMEMNSQQLVFRMISSLGRVNQAQLRTGNFGDEAWPRIRSAMGLLQDAPLYIDDTGGLSPSEIRARARRLKREAGGLGLIVVDYLQLMAISGNTENRATEISEISRNLKALAKELEVPVIALSQLNRSVEQRHDKKPVMSDLRESGAIEQDADLICFIYRDEVYNAESPRKGIADIIIAKQRNGPTGDVPLTFLGEFTKFENFVAEAYAEEAFR
jgi:replicative DNA helicase